MKPIPGFEGKYSITETGDIIPWNRSKPLAQGVNQNGYSTVRLHDGAGKSITFSVHRLVLRAFRGEPTNDKPLGLHNNGIKRDNRLENLRWGSASDNMQDRVKHGGNYNTEKTHCKRGHPLSGDNLYLTVHKKGRSCRTCMRMHQANAKERSAREGLSPTDPRHGTYNGYTRYKCRCVPCTLASKEAHKKYHSQRSKNG